MTLFCLKPLFDIKLFFGLKKSLGISLLTVFAGELQAVELFEPAQVRLLASPFQKAQELDLAYIAELDADRLIAPYLREAGLKPKAEPYGNWESSGLDGHIAGHYISALSLAYAATGDEQYRKQLDYVLSELQKVQKANGNGYLGGVPESEVFWKQIKNGEIEANLFGLNGRWVPWYNIHKMYAGLRDAYWLAGSDVAKKLLLDFGQWTLDITSKLSDSQIQNMLYAEHGGMNEVLADIYSISGDKRYLALAEKYSERRILNPLLNHKDELSGLHANTQIPKVVGFARIAELTDNTRWMLAAQFFWEQVVYERTVAIGGNSVSEHFHDKANFKEMFEAIQGPETCNTYNMLKLSEILYRNKGEVKYIEFYERALYNHILSSQHPATGGLVYFTPMRPQHYRTYSQVDKAMWCCVGSGIENHLKYNHFIYAHKDDQLYINLFIPSRLEWKQRDVVLSQKNTIPDEEKTQITIEQGGTFTLNIRIPSWLKESPKLSLNGKVFLAKNDGDYLKIERTWQKGDGLELLLPMRTRAESMPDGGSYYALLHGPVVLSAPVTPFPEEQLSFFADGSRMGHVAAGRQCAVHEAPMIISESKDFLNRVERIPGDRLRFKFNKLSGAHSSLELLPFFRVHGTRYMIYWQLLNPAELEEIKAKQAALEQARLELEKLTVDWVSAGEQQPEVEHKLKFKNSEAGVHRGRHWRHAFDWFSYQLNNESKLAESIRLTLSKEDADRHYQILLNGELLDTVHTKTYAESGFYDLEYPLPDSIKKASTIEFKLKALPGSMAGGLYEVRLLKAQSKKHKGN